jgi:hypothetical protein
MSHPPWGIWAHAFATSRYLALVRKTLCSAARAREPLRLCGASELARASRPPRPDIGGGVNPNHALRGCGSGSIPRSTCRGAFPRARARRAAPMATIRPQQGRRGAAARTRAALRLGTAPAAPRARCRCLPSARLRRNRPGTLPVPCGEIQPAGAGGHRGGGGGRCQARSSKGVIPIRSRPPRVEARRADRQQDLPLAVHRSALDRPAPCSAQRLPAVVRGLSVPIRGA